MRRHETDVVSLAAGLLFLVVAVVHISARATGTELNVRWLVPTTLLLLGVLGLLGALRSPRGTATEPAEPSPLSTARVTDAADETLEVSTEE